MPFLDITSAQPSLQIHLGNLRARNLLGGKELSSSFVSRNITRLVSSWKSLNIPMKLHTDVKSFEIRKGRIFVKAVPTVETNNLVQEHDELNGNNNSHFVIDPILVSESEDEDSVEMDEKEKLRRKRISMANKGKKPWNFGRKHSAETLMRIRERTRIAMQDPKIRKKLVKLGHAQTEKTKEKIGVGVRKASERRRERLYMQEACFFHWQNLIAEASRIGSLGEEELQWNSYEILNEQLHKEFLESMEKKKLMKAKGWRRAPKSPEQRRKIAEAIAAKWATPEYRGKVISGIAKYHGSTDRQRTERKPRRKQSSSTESPRQSRPKKASEMRNYFVSETKSQTQKYKKRKPLYKDPLASSKLEMIKQIRAQRAAAETRKAEAIAPARLAIAEAERAAKALELAAETSPIAREALLETRKLIAEAIQSIESIETGNGEESPDASVEFANHFEENKDELMNHEENRNINGTQTLVPSNSEESDYGKISVQDILMNDSEEFVLTTSSRGGNILPEVNKEVLMKQLSITPMEQPTQLVSNGNTIFEKGPSPNGAFHQIVKEVRPPRSVGKTKKWVRGRLVEVSEEEEEDQDLSESEEEEKEGKEEEEDQELSEEEEDQDLSEEVEDWSLSEEEEE